MKSAISIAALLIQILFLKSACSASLPFGYSLEKNSAGDMYLANSKGVILVYPKILSYGYNENYFVACIKDKIQNADLKRYSFVNFVNGNAIATSNLKQWIYFLNVIPGLGEVKLKQVGDEPCP